ncbi:gp53-like domain-containing protein [Paraburkholderia susongensis]|uniref:Putative tail fiber protein gp53-like C-terminal domain-containing protein n=1 Tax=Paraburkholderia susongensis TaxID=1515439 RepID=A0A1X7I494_9BURK|nr:hypothetical protein [Paraburkholderia susongensis]SMG09234.1 hypothetical protein SAMN06265784_101313 [Paraburkholderia susongensis]
MDFPSNPDVGLVDGQFVDENEATGRPGSLIPSSWGNALTLEILNVIRAAGLTPDENNVAQLLAALPLFTRTLQATEALAGVARIATQALTNAGVDDTTIVTPRKLRNGFAAVIGGSGYVAFPTWLGGLIIQWGIGVADVNGVVSIPFATTFPTSIAQCLATYITPGPATGVAANVSNASSNSAFAGAAFNTLTGVGVHNANVAYLAIGH